MQENKYMYLAIELAKKGLGFVNPNPMVGAVVVKDGKIISTGYHEKYGCPHAERNALEKCSEEARGADIYVTLEPCCHFGKNPPCTDIIIEKGIKNVYAGSDDPNTLVGGKGFEILKKHGINVKTHVLKEECDAINKPFFHYITTKTPYVVMKYAMTADGKIACESGDSRWVSCEKARELVQKYRFMYSAIMVGVNTVITDNPMLTCRIEGAPPLIRIICDTHLRTPVTSNIVKTAAQIPTIIAVSQDEDFGEKELEMLKYGVELVKVPLNNGHIDLKELMLNLGSKGIDSILLEGGGYMNFSALKAGIVNEVKVFISPKIVGGSCSPVSGAGVDKMADCFNLRLDNTEIIGEDILCEYTAER